MEKVRQGEQVVIKASTWNGFVDAANFVKEARQNSLGAGIRSGVGGGIVPLKNMEDRDYPRFSALVITGVAVSPSANEDEFVSCPTVFEGQRMIAEREDMPYAVLLEPIAAHEIGRAMLLGLTPAKVLVQSADDQYAVPKANSDDGALESPRRASPASCGRPADRGCSGASSSSAGLAAARPTRGSPCAR